MCLGHICTYTIYMRDNVTFSGGGAPPPVMLKSHKPLVYHDDRDCVRVALRGGFCSGWHFSWTEKVEGR